MSTQYCPESTEPQGQSVTSVKYALYTYEDRRLGYIMPVSCESLECGLVSRGGVKPSTTRSPVQTKQGNRTNLCKPY